MSKKSISIATIVVVIAVIVIGITISGIARVGVVVAPVGALQHVSVADKAVVKRVVDRFLVSSNVDAVERVQVVNA